MAEEVQNVERGESAVIEPAALSYQRGAPGGVSATRRQCVRMLTAWGWLLLVFALLVGWVVVDRVMLERKAVWSRVVNEFWGPVWQVRYVWVVHWSRVVWVAGFMLPAAVLGPTYLLLGRVMLRRRERVYVVTALALTVLHTLVGTGLAITFFVAGARNMEWRLISVVTAAASVLGVAMVAGMGYLSVRLMDLLGERAVVTAGGNAEQAVAKESDPVGELERLEEEPEEEDRAS